MGPVMIKPDAEITSFQTGAESNSTDALSTAMTVPRKVVSLGEGRVNFNKTVGPNYFFFVAPEYAARMYEKRWSENLPASR